MDMGLIPAYCPYCGEQMQPVTYQGHDQFWCAYHGYQKRSVDGEGRKQAID